MIRSGNNYRVCLFNRFFLFYLINYDLLDVIYLIFFVDGGCYISLMKGFLQNSPDIFEFKLMISAHIYKENAEGVIRSSAGVLQYCD